MEAGRKPASAIRLKESHFGIRSGSARCGACARFDDDSAAKHQPSGRRPSSPRRHHTAPRTSRNLHGLSHFLHNLPISHTFSWHTIISAHGSIHVTLLKMHLPISSLHITSFERTFLPSATRTVPRVKSRSSSAGGI